ncbi:ribonuclease HI [Gulosibacter macacae]|uniref:Ribonuclease H n=1 Tax=Gulosibacter macacae TaxID=2488791 RepID=A0A3P3VWI4_9MICO|nr:ribonuclease H [Gulosibacter macacae]RRJ86804.1 ribonuclease HI [Gulosibacter macacae]
MQILAAADGSSLGNPGPAGWAWVTSDGAWRSGGWPRGTNNMGELMAVLDLLEHTADTGASLRILCDSQYVINSVTKWMPGWKRKGWKKADGKPVQNRELLERIDAALAGRDVAFEWVKGHAGHDLNEAADSRARAAAEAYSKGREPDAGPGLGAAAAAPSAGPDASAESGKPAAAAPMAATPTAPAPTAAPTTRDDTASTATDLNALFDDALFDDALFDNLDADGDIEADAATANLTPESHALSEIAALERADASDRRHPDFEQVGRPITGELTELRVILTSPATAIVRSRIDGVERTSLWQRDTGEAASWLLRLRHEG